VIAPPTISAGSAAPAAAGTSSGSASRDRRDRQIITNSTHGVLEARVPAVATIEGGGTGIDID